MSGNSTPERYIYKYQEKTQKDKPSDNITYITDATKDDPLFYWHIHGERRGTTIWRRAINRKLSPKYTKWLEERTQGLINTIADKLLTSGFTITNEKKYNIHGEPSYSYMLRTGKTSHDIKAENAPKMEVTPDILKGAIMSHTGVIDEDIMDSLIERLGNKLGIKGMNNDGMLGGKRRKTVRKVKKSRKTSRHH